MEEYKEYETAPAIEDKWRDSTVIGLCGHCGLDDAPIVIPEKETGLRLFSGEEVISRAKCKWCAEKDNLDYHLKYKGSRTKEEIRRRIEPTAVEFLSDIWNWVMDLNVFARAGMLLLTAYVIAVFVFSITH